MNELQKLVKEVLNSEVEFEELENKDKHKVLWTYLGINGSCYKDEFFDNFIEIENIPVNKCYACEQADDQCCYCPITWNDEHYTHSEYCDWENAKKKEERSKIALIIANLPWENKR